MDSLNRLWLAMIIVAFKAVKAEDMGTITTLELTKLFMREMKIAKIFEDILEVVKEEDADIPDELHWFQFSHQYVMDEIRFVGISSLGDVVNPANFDRLQHVVMDKLVSNSVHIFNLIKRTFLYVDPIIEWFQAGIWTSEHDLSMAALSLARIQHVYQLSALDLSRGLIGTKQTEARLFSEDCQFIAESRMIGQYPLMPTSDRKEYALAIEWTEAAYELSKDSFGINDKETQDILIELISLRTKHDLWHKPPSEGNGPSRYPNESFFISKLGKNLNVTGRFLRQVEKDVFGKRFAGKVDFFPFSRRDFFALCRGEEIILENVPRERPRKCWLEAIGNPYLILQPLKVEYVKQTSLELKVIREALSDSQVDILKSLSMQKIQKAMVFNQNMGGNASDYVSLDRTQSIAWLSEAVIPELIPLAKRLDDVTGLQVSFEVPPEKVDYYIRESEAFQIGIYNPGGLYLPHHDYLTVSHIKWYKDLWLGDRIATAMIYLNECDGGRTVFPDIGASVAPEKGSIVFWYNLNHDGSPAEESIHGGCPVLYGTKLVSNKWIREGSQLFKRPCSSQMS